ncbi:GNAT family N-acetyltransferase [Mucilaginibacter achroorhodeus]|uniref:GNAT family N-acetyltransferase n=1 Tax=Mucilaginibacter achroorhodeus TaxID=2599294 RepID=A0A563U8M2_9SPHI|nr:GNAT family N-acetyltransferase [Mucilaginibacter achroorhodeus]TWR27688.1 GNAT family N-acetyltransferase [Mucilaginibacter achroorhodeus]
MPLETEAKRISDPIDLEKAFAIRREVFVDGQNCPPDLESEFNDDATHFLATVEGQPAGAARYRKTDKGYKLERFAVLDKYRGYGIGQALIKAVLADLPAHATYVYLHAQVQAVGLYEKFGFKPSGPQFEEAGIQHYKMVKED